MAVHKPSTGAFDSDPESLGELIPGITPAAVERLAGLPDVTVELDLVFVDPARRPRYEPPV